MAPKTILLIGLKRLPQRHTNIKGDVCSICYKILTTVGPRLTDMEKFSVLPWKSFVEIVHMCALRDIPFCHQVSAFYILNFNIQCCLLIPYLSFNI